MKDKRILEAVSRFSDSYEPILTPDDVPQALLDSAGRDALRRARCESGQNRKHRARRITLAACVAAACIAAGLILWLPRTPDGSHQAAVSATATASTAPMDTALPSGAILAESGDGQIIARSYTGELPMSASMMDIRGMSSDEIFTEYDTLIFRGTITDIQYIEIVSKENAQGYVLTLLDYYGIVSVEVASSVRGEAQPGETVRILVYGLTDPDANMWVEDTDIVSQMRVGMEGIFLPVPLAAGEAVSHGGSSLSLSGLAPYRLADGMHFVILDAPDGLAYATWAYRGMEASSLDAAEASIRGRLDMIEHADEYPLSDLDRISGEQTYGELRKVGLSQEEFAALIETEGLGSPDETDALMDRTFWYEDNRYYYFFSCIWDDTYGAMVAQVEKTP